MKNENKEQKIDTEISANSIMGEPETAFDLINKYGTYEIQPTAESENEFPCIAQGNPSKPKTKEEKW